MSRECITFEVGGQTFALDIGVIREIRGWAPVTRVPGMPPMWQAWPRCMARSCR
jgi:purine-binding chemotaxis protein CheW